MRGFLIFMGDIIMIMTKDDLYYPIKGKEQDILELFIEFFGEKHRDKITRNHKNTEMFFMESDAVESIQQLYSDKIDDLVGVFYEQLGFLPGEVPTPTDLPLIKKALKSRQYDPHDDVITSFVSGVERKPVEDAAKYLRNPFHYIKVMKSLDKSIHIWDTEFRDKYQAIYDEGKALFDPIKEQNKQVEKKVSDIESDINRMYINHAKKILVSNGIMPLLVDRVCAAGIKSLMFIGKSGLRDPFMVDEEQQDAIMSLFKMMGYDRGDDYEAYISDDTIVDSVFDAKFISQVNHLEKQKILQTAVNNPQFIEAKDRIAQLNYADGDMTLLASMCMYLSNSGTGGFNQCHFGYDGSLRPICVCPLGATLDDEILLHELGHAYQTGLVSMQGNEFKVKTGLEVLDYKCEHDKFDYDKLFEGGVVSRGDAAVEQLSMSDRKYRLTSEVIHDILTKLLVQLSQSKGYKFGANDGSCRKTIYSYASDMVESFVMDNLDFIKDAFMSDDPYMLIDALGKDKLDALEQYIERVVCVPLPKRQSILHEIESSGLDGSYADMSKLSGWSSATKEYLSQFALAQDLLHGVKLQKSM